MLLLRYRFWTGPYPPIFPLRTIVVLLVLSG